jgi:D-tyrosyl-tRNA(Tyr) deacylase
MIALIQRVKEAKVIVDDKVISSIGKGILVFLGVSKEDTEESTRWLADKIINLRIFENNQGKMHHTVADEKLEIMVVPQFTLLANCQKGRRPSFDLAAEPEWARKLYEYFIEYVKIKGMKVSCGIFQARMEVQLINDGPVTFTVTSPKEKK